MDKRQTGFTLIELMIATTVFSMIMILCSIGLLQIGRYYYKGLTSAKTQEVARTVMDDIAQAIQFGGQTPSTITGSPNKILCVGSRRYSFLEGVQLKDPPSGSARRNVLVVDDFSGCSTVAQDLNDNGVILTATSKELLAPNMRLANLDVTETPAGSGLYEVTVRIVSGDDEVLTATLDSCKNERDGTLFCAVSELKTTVKKRI